MREDKENPPASLETLNALLDEVKRHRPEAAPQKKLPGDAARPAIDFASATAVGSLLGYGWDMWQNTPPWGLLVGLLIGTGAGAKLLLQNEAREHAALRSKKKETAED